jgi:hypothetical protein
MDKKGPLVFLNFFITKKIPHVKGRRFIFGIIIEVEILGKDPIEQMVSYRSKISNENSDLTNN